MAEITHTKEMIARNMISLIEKKSIDKITVKDLVELCGISRQTFYYHFQDTIDVVEWSMEKIVEAKIAEGMRIDDPKEALYRMITYSNKEKEILNNLLRSQRKEQIERAIIKNMRLYMETMIKNKNSALRINPADMNVLLDFWTFGIVGSLLSSMSRGDLDERKLAGQIVDLISGEVFR